jgi:outer membrane protein TolC
MPGAATVQSVAPPQVMSPAPAVTSIPQPRLPAELPHLEAPPEAPATSDRTGQKAVPAPKAAAEAFQTTSQDDIAKNFEPYPGGLTADQVVRQALVTSPELKKARTAVSRAEANKQRAKIAFVPRVDLTGRFTHMSRVKMGAFPMVFVNNPRVGADGVTVEGIDNLSFAFPQVLNQWYSQAAVVVPVTDFFLTIAPMYKTAKLSADVALQQERAKRLQVAYDARVTFYQYCHLKGGLVVAQASVGMYEATVRDLESLVAAGSATETDLIRAKAAKAQAEHFVAQFKGGVAVSLTRLTQLVGSDVPDLPNVGERLLAEVPTNVPDAAAVTKQALAERPELLALRTVERMRKHTITARKGAQYPRLAGFANGYYANPNQRIFPQQDQWRGTYDVGALLTWSPNDAVQAHLQVSDAESDLADLHSDLQAVEDGIGMEAANAISTLSSAASEVDSSTQVLTASRRYFDDKRALMLAGAATPNDVLQAQTALTRDALSWVDAYVNVRVAQAALLKVQGKTGLESEAPQDTRNTP